MKANSRYLKPPMLRLTVASLAKLVEDSPTDLDFKSQELINREVGTESNAIDSH